MQLLTVIIAPTTLTEREQVTISSSFLAKDAKRRKRWCSLIKRRHGQDGFVISTSTVLCHEHFRTEDISKKLTGRWILKKGL